MASALKARFIPARNGERLTANRLIAVSTSSGPERKPKGNALSALVNNPLKKPGAFPQAEVRPRRWR